MLELDSSSDILHFYNIAFISCALKWRSYQTASIKIDKSPVASCTQRHTRAHAPTHTQTCKLQKNSIILKKTKTIIHDYMKQMWNKLFEKHGIIQHMTVTQGEKIYLLTLSGLCLRTTNGKIRIMWTRNRRNYY